ncbi:MAG: Gfo/Idh/MocA family oxidoreductase [Bacteroidetes bacterium]|nr:MAG: Gfo/Idh/MocA family oxidoreductase [Bacteroidota bacterium]
MEKVRVGIVGLGWVAQIFHLPILSKMDDVEIVAVCDKDKSRAKFIAERFGINSWYSDYEEMVKRDDLHAVDICTSTDAHLPVALAAMQGGSDVFVEKPIARHYDEALKMSEAAKEYKRKIMVGMNNRFRPDAMILKSFIEGGDLGKIFYVKAGWLRKLTADNAWLTRKEKAGGGVFLDLGIVLLDLSLWMLAFPTVHRVSAKMFNHGTKNVEDTCLGFFEMKNGITVFFESSWAFQAEQDFFYCEFFGSEGSAKLNPLQIHKQLHGSLVNVTPAKSETPQNLYKKSYENELKHFIGSVRGFHKIVSTAEEAVHRMKVVEALYKSAAKRKEIIIK